MTKAAKAFDAFIGGKNPSGEKISLSKAAAALGVTDPTIIAWRRGDKRPTPPLRDAIERWTSGAVQADDWMNDEERSRTTRAAAVEPFAGKGAA